MIFISRVRGYEGTGVREYLYRRKLREESVPRTSKKTKTPGKVISRTYSLAEADPRTLVPPKKTYKLITFQTFHHYDNYSNYQGSWRDSLVRGANEYGRQEDDDRLRSPVG